MRGFAGRVQTEACEHQTHQRSTPHAMRQTHFTDHERRARSECEAWTGADGFEIGVPRTFQLATGKNRCHLACTNGESTASREKRTTTTIPLNHRTLPIQTILNVQDSHHPQQTAANRDVCGQLAALQLPPQHDAALHPPCIAKRRYSVKHSRRSVEGTLIKGVPHWSFKPPNMCSTPATLPLACHQCPASEFGPHPGFFRFLSARRCRVTGPLLTRSRPPTSHQTLDYTPDRALHIPGFDGIGERGGEGGEREGRGFC